MFKLEILGLVEEISHCFASERNRSSLDANTHPFRFSGSDMMLTLDGVTPRLFEEKDLPSVL
jgi:hypothetical protein